jgi:hypothetical protein
MDLRKHLMQLVSEHRTPLLLVQSSSGAEQIAKKNALTVADLLRPFGDIRNVSIPFRTPGKSFQLNHVSVRTVHASELACVSIETLDAQLGKRLAVSAPAAYPDMPIGSHEEAHKFVTRVSARGDATPWCTEYRKDTNRLLRCLPQEQADLPVGMLVVASTSDASPIQCFHELASSSALPRPFQTDHFDPDLPKYFVLLHDVGASATGEAINGQRALDPAAVMRELKSFFPPNSCHILPINSLSTGANSVNVQQADIWSPFMPDPAFQATYLAAGLLPPAPAATAATLPTTPTQGQLARQSSDLSEQVVTRAMSAPNTVPSSSPSATASYADQLLQVSGAPARGCYLSGDDLLAIRSIITKILTEGLLPAMESKIFNLISSVNSKKTGLREAVKSWWSGGGGGGGSASGLPPTATTPGAAGASARGGIFGDKVGSGFDSSDGGLQVGGDVATVMYPYGTYESQLRHLADLSFIVGDYESAHNNYKKLRDEIKLEKAPSYYAAANEMAGIALMMTAISGGSTFASVAKEVDGHLELAVQWYYRSAQLAMSQSPIPLGSASYAAADMAAAGSAPAAGSPANTPIAAALQSSKRLAIRLATRAALIAADCMLMGAISPGSATVTASNSAMTLNITNGRVRETAQLLRRVGQAEGDGSLASAVCTEQAGYTCLRASPSLFRRGGHLLYLAGQFYSTANQPRHAVRCLRLAFSVFCRKDRDVPPEFEPLEADRPKTVSWPLIDEQLRIFLIQKHLQLGDIAAAVPIISDLLSVSGTSGRPAAPLHRGLLRELLRSHATNTASSSATTTKASKELAFTSLPQFADHSVQIASFSNAYAAALASEIVMLQAERDRTVAAAACEAWKEKLGLPTTANLSAVVQHPVSHTPHLAHLFAQGGSGAAGLEPLFAAFGIGDVWSSSSSCQLKPCATYAGLFNGYLPGEGAPLLSVTNVVSSPWAKMDAQQQREQKLRDKHGADVWTTLAAVDVNVTTKPTISAAVSSDDPRPLWRRFCHELGVAAVEEDEAREKARLDATIIKRNNAITAAVTAPGVTENLLADEDGDIDDTDGNRAAVHAAAPSLGQRSLEVVARLRNGGSSALSSGKVRVGGASSGYKPRYFQPDQINKVTERNVGEPFVITLTLTNPCAIELPIQNLRVDCTWLGAEEATVVDAIPSDDLFPSSSHKRAESGTVDGLHCVSVDCLLAPSETRTVRLLCRAMRTGSFVMRGIRWDLAGIVPCRHDFVLRTPPLNDTRHNKAASARAVDKRMEGKVVAPKEWAGVSLQLQNPQRDADGMLVLLDGEVAQADLTLHNFGGVPIDFAFVRFAGKGHCFLSLAPNSSNSASVVSSGAFEGLDAATFGLPLAEPLAPGASVSWLVNVFTSGSGSRTLRFNTVYGNCARLGIDRPVSSQLVGEGLTARVLQNARAARWCARVQIVPSVGIVTSVLPNAQIPGEYRLTVKVTHAARHNASTSASAPYNNIPVPITLTSVRAISDFWCLELESVQSSLGSSADIDVSPAWPLGRPLAYNETRTYTYSVRACNPELMPTYIVDIDNDSECHGGNTQVTESAHRLLAAATDASADVGAPVMALMRLHQAAKSIGIIIAGEKRKEIMHRKAAEEADHLPPTLRSIAQERTAAAEAQAERAAYHATIVSENSLPGSPLALLRGRKALHLVVGWQVAPDIPSAITHSTGRETAGVRSGIALLMDAATDTSSHEYRYGGSASQAAAPVKAQDKQVFAPSLSNVLVAWHCPSFASAWDDVGADAEYTSTSLILYNCGADEDGPASIQVHFSAGQNSAAESVHWVGSSSRKVNGILPGQRVIVPCAVTFGRTGVYVLSATVTPTGVPTASKFITTTRIRVGAREDILNAQHQPLQSPEPTVESFDDAGLDYASTVSNETPTAAVVAAARSNSHVEASSGALVAQPIVTDHSADARANNGDDVFDNEDVPTVVQPAQQALDLASPSAFADGEDGSEQAQHQLESDSSQPSAEHVVEQSTAGDAAAATAAAVDAEHNDMPVVPA